MIVFYVLFILSVLCPVYTYVLYPLLLKVMKEKTYETDDIEPFVSVVIVGENAEKKIQNVQRCNYSKFEVIKGDYSCVDKMEGEIILFTDIRTELDRMAVREIVKPFADDRVACVVGQQVDQEGNGIFWKYENLVKSFESKIGCVSGVTESIFAVRKSEIPFVDKEVLNKPFYIANMITKNGKNIIFWPFAKAYERRTGGTNFNKHVQDAVGYWQALKIFAKVHLPCKGSFVFISHRVMKWFVWLNMILMLITSGILAISGSIWIRVLFAAQIIVYMTVLLLGRKDISGVVGKFIQVGYYFVMLNVAYLVGLIKQQ